MLPPELIIAVVFIGAIHFAIGLFIGWHLRPARNSMSLPPHEVTGVLAALQESLSRTANQALASRLEAIIALNEQLATTPSAECSQWTEQLGALVEQVIQTVKQSQDLIVEAAARIDSQHSMLTNASSADTVGLAGEQWFPTKPTDDVPPANELRRMRRFRFEHIQRIGLIHGEELPQPSHFFEVRFYDISSGGFSFYIAERLTAERLVAELGAPSNTVSVLAQVMHQRVIDTSDGVRFLVGCKILKRLDSAVNKPPTNP